MPLSIAAYLRRYYPPCRSWTREALLRWVRWLIGHGYLLYVTREGRIVGVLAARPILTADQGRDYFAHDEEGPVIWVDLIATNHPLAMASLWLAGRRRFGLRPEIACYRKSDQRLRIFPSTSLQNKILAPARRLSMALQASRPPHATPTEP